MGRLSGTLLPQARIWKGVVQNIMVIIQVRTSLRSEFANMDARVASRGYR